MRVSYYCQHVLGIGHFQRSLEICRAIAKKNPTTLILGGPEVDVPYPELEILKLPGLRMDSNFKNLQPCDPELTLDQVKLKRQNELFNHFRENKPDIFLTELYPFGRKAFRFELDPILLAIKQGSLRKCLCISSVRDILVEKETGREKFEKRVIDTLNSYFDGVLVHADPKIIKLDETFRLFNEIKPPVNYTGYVTTAASVTQATAIREEIGLKSTDRLIVASIGGGNVGSELLSTTIAAVKILQAKTSVYLQVFCGPYCDLDLYESLKQQQGQFIRVKRFTNRFPDWLQAADLSISMAGYNTCMNLIHAGIPSIVYPFKQNREQRLRAEKLAMYAPMEIIDGEPNPETLIIKIWKQLALKRVPPQIDLGGAQKSEQQINLWFVNQQDND